MNIDENREMISLQETLAYLKYINREKPFDKQTVQIPTKDYQQIIQANKIKPLTREQVKKANLQEQDEDYKKKINKNRAIKRIIQSSKQILQGFNNYESQQKVSNSEKSATVQFNIYLKQYNRVLQLIYNKEKEELNNQAKKGQERQEILQNIYEFTVVEDFREILPVATLKQKILKANIEIMINALTDCLVVLKSNQLRIYESTTMNSPSKIIKLHEIENVDYHNQPYIFIVLTVQKDKERSNIYIRFQSSKNQDKWDRALYCCFMSRKMKKKDKLFSIQYPQDDVKKKQKEEIKKVAAFSYEPDRKVIQRSFLQKKGINRSDKSNRDDMSEYGNEFNPSTSKKSQTEKSVNPKKNLSNKSVSNPDKVDQSENLQKSQDGINKQTKQTKQSKNKGTQTQRYIQSQKIQSLSRQKTDNPTINRTQQNISEVEIPATAEKLNKIKQDSDVNINSGDEDEPPSEEPPRVQLPNEIREIHELQRKNVKGITVKKQRFFMNKEKIIFLRESPSQQNKANQTNKANQVKTLKPIQLKNKEIIQEIQAIRQRQLQYWDYDQKQGSKSECKVIKVMKIVRIEQNLQKNTLYIKHEKQKEIIFVGQRQKLGDIRKWLELIAVVLKINISQLIPPSQNPPILNNGPMVNTMQNNPPNTMQTNPPNNMQMNPTNTMQSNPTNSMQMNPTNTMQNNPSNMQTNNNNTNINNLQTIPDHRSHPLNQTFNPINAQ